jgi:hydroxymethylpyrimidine/phosphomethylpyrimidine kinase
MHGQRPYVLTIAGFDPTSGAGLTADIKTFEQNRVYGLAVCTGITLQTDNQFFSVSWRKAEEVKKEIGILLHRFPVSVAKFGIVPSLEFLAECIAHLKKISPAIQIVVDPVWKSGTGFEFAVFNDLSRLEDLLKEITLLTPNRDELKEMAGENNPLSFAKVLARHTNILVKGGHAENEQRGTDLFYDDKRTREIKPNAYHVFPKHGSGCVLSAAIAAQLALQYDVYDACVNAKRYTETFLSSNESLLGYHAA